MEMLFVDLVLANQVVEGWCPECTWQQTMLLQLLLAQAISRLETWNESPKLQFAHKLTEPLLGWSMLILGLIKTQLE